MDHTSLVDIANAMVQKGKGILAADESTPTCKKRFDTVSYTHLTLPTILLV